MRAVRVDEDARLEAELQRIPRNSRPGRAGTMKEGIFISQLHLRAWLLDESFQVNVDEHA